MKNRVVKWDHINLTVELEDKMDLWLHFLLHGLNDKELEYLVTNKYLEKALKHSLKAYIRRSVK